MFTATLFIIAKTCKQLRCPAVGEWINKLRYIQTMEYSALKRSELPNHEKTLRNFNKCMLLNERSQFEKATYCMISTI